MTLAKPTLVLDERRARRNIARMAERARRFGVRFRPHFKTRQSQYAGRIFRESTTASELKKIKAGDILFVLPVHSCLTVNLFKEYVRLDGRRIPTIRGSGLV